MATYDQLMLYQAIASGPSLVTEVADRVGLGTAPSSADQARITNALNYIQKLMTRRHNWRSLERTDSSLLTVKDQLRYRKPPHIKHIRGARLIDDTAYVLDSCDRM